MKRKVLAALLAWPCLATGAAAPAQTAPAAYTEVKLAPYVLRSRGDDAMGAVLTALEAGFHRHYPQVTFARVLNGSGTGMAGVITSLSDLSLMGRQATSNEVMGFEWVFRYKPQGVAVMRGRLDAPEGGSPALRVLVPKANPLKSLTLAQMKTLTTCPESCSDSPTGGVTWGMAGLTGAWSGRPVHVYLYDEETGTGAFLQQAVEGRGDRWNWQVVREYRDEAGKPPAARRIAEAVLHDPDGLGVSSVSLPGLRTVALGELAVTPTDATIADESYPLGRAVSLYLNQPPDKPAPPAVREFLRFVLSAEGQAIVARQGDYLPLSPAAAAREQATLR